MGVGKVLWHSLTEDGKVERVNIKFGKSVYEDVDVRHLNPIDEGSHSHPKRKKNADKKKKKTESKMSLKLEELVGKKLTEEQFDEAAGKKDACYYKVKARYDVWPSAYASGALVKCRKVGAKNWGNKSKKEGLDDLKALPKDLKKSIKKNREEGLGDKFGKTIDKYNKKRKKNMDALKKLKKEDKAKVLKLLIKRGNNPQDAKSDVEKLYNKVSKMYKNASNSKKAEIISALSARMESVNEARGTCWVGYQQVGMKKKGGKMVPNCVKEIIEIYYEQNGEGHGYTFEHIKDLSLNEAEYQGRKVKLGKIMQGDTKKFKVYVKNPKGNVVKVNFGQGGKAKGGTMRIRKSNAAARKSFRARHNCDNPGPRHKARYWSCRKW